MKVQLPFSWHDRLLVGRCSLERVPAAEGRRVVGAGGVLLLKFSRSGNLLMRWAVLTDFAPPSAWRRSSLDNTHSHLEAAVCCRIQHWHHSWRSCLSSSSSQCVLYPACQTLSFANAVPHDMALKMDVTIRPRHGSFPYSHIATRSTRPMAFDEYQRHTEARSSTCCPRAQRSL